MPTPYEVKCSCGRSLYITHRSMDSDGDVSVDVEPCEDCLDKAANEAADKARADSA